MGRTSKFLFPLPSRKNQHNRALSKTSVNESPQNSTLTKAERILGAGGPLNVNSPPVEDDQTWKSLKGKSSRMSISISESTENSDDEESRQEAWDVESGVLGVPRLRSQSASTVLGQYREHEGLTDTSSVSRRVRNEDSSSTLASHYDRQKNPLSISQQTSSSSARDLALRKGLNTVAGTSRPLVHVDSPDETRGSPSIKSPESYKKKPGRLDISKLFPKPSQDIANPTLLGPDSLTHSPAAMSFISTFSNTYHFPRPGRSATPVNNSSLDEEYVSPKGTSRIKPQYSVQSLPERCSNRRKPELPLRAIPERSSSRNLYSPFPEREVENLTGPQLMALHTPPASLESSVSPTSKKSHFSWKHVRDSAGGSSNWDSGSAITSSSINTRNSKKTTASILDTADLSVCSVLSLTSDEDSDISDDEHARQIEREQISRQSNHTIPAVEPLQPPVTVERSTTVTKKKPKQRIDTMKIPKSRFRDSRFLPLPMPSPINTRLSGPWAGSEPSPAPTIELPGIPGQKKEKMNNTPPTSPSSQKGKKGNARYMAVNAQERALLEALRQKKIRMREDSIAEDVVQEDGAGDGSSPPTVSLAPGKHTNSKKGAYRSQSSLGMRESQKRDSKLSNLSEGSGRLSRASFQESPTAGDSGRLSRASVLERNTDSRATIRPGDDAVILRGESGGCVNHLHVGGGGGGGGGHRTRSQDLGQQSRSRSQSQSQPQNQPQPHPQPQHHPAPRPQSQSQNYPQPQNPPPSHPLPNPQTTTPKRLTTREGDILIALERLDTDEDIDIQTAEPSPDLAEFYRESFGLGDGYRYYSDSDNDDRNGNRGSRYGSSKNNTTTGDNERGVNNTNAENSRKNGNGSVNKRLDKGRPDSVAYSFDGSMFSMGFSAKLKSVKHRDRDSQRKSKAAGLRGHGQHDGSDDRYLDSRHHQTETGSSTPPPIGLVGKSGRKGEKRRVSHRSSYDRRDGMENGRGDSTRDSTLSGSGRGSNEDFIEENEIGSRNNNEAGFRDTRDTFGNIVGIDGDGVMGFMDGDGDRNSGDGGDREGDGNRNRKRENRESGIWGL